MTKALIHLLDNEFNPVCDTTKKNIDGTHQSDKVTCKICQFKGPRKILNLEQLTKEINFCVSKLKI